MHLLLIFDIFWGALYGKKGEVPIIIVHMDQEVYLSQTVHLQNYFLDKSINLIQRANEYIYIAIAMMDIQQNNI